MQSLRSIQAVSNKLKENAIRLQYLAGILEDAQLMQIADNAWQNHKTLEVKVVQYANDSVLQSGRRVHSAKNCA